LAPPDFSFTVFLTFFFQYKNREGFISHV
jgi:hypothetical protein